LIALFAYHKDHVKIINEIKNYEKTANFKVNIPVSILREDKRYVAQLGHYHIATTKVKKGLDKMRQLE